MSQTALADTITSRLRLIEDLRTKLVHVKWSRDVFVLLVRVLRDTLQSARGQPEYRNLAESTEQLEKQVNAYLQEGRLPRGAERRDLFLALENIQRLLPNSGTDTADERSGRLERLPNEIGPLLLLGGEDCVELGRRLELEGYSVRRTINIAQAREQMIRGQPSAAIVDLDYIGADGDGAEAVRTQLGPKVPLFCLAERGDLEARLDVVNANVAGYFVKPLQESMFIETIGERLLSDSLRGCRVLIVTDQQSQGRNMARVLEAKGMLTQILTQSLLVLHAVHRFQPHLILQDLVLKDVDGLKLARALRQHELSNHCGLVLLATASELEQQRQALANSGGQDILLKPYIDECFLSVVTQRLRQLMLTQQRQQYLELFEAHSGLLTRAAFLEQVQQALRRRTPTQPLGLMMVSVEDLHELTRRDVILADQLSAEIGKRLRYALGTGYQPAHFSDHVFAVLIDNTYQEAMLATARSVRKALSTEPYILGRDTFSPRLSVGISLTGPDTNDLARLIGRALDSCQQAASSSNSEGIQIHRQAVPDQQDAEYHLRRLLEEIGDTVKQQRLSLVFQPIVSLRGDGRERYEMLLRLRNQEGRELLPETVFAIAQHHRVGIVLDRWVIAQALRLLRERQAKPPILFINISAAILQDSAMMEWLSAGLEKTRVTPGNLVFELPESAARQHAARAAAFIDRLHQLGCGFSMERFAGSESSLALALKLKVNYAKFDRSFVENLTTDRALQERLASVASSLKNAQITPVVSCVEDSATLATLWQCGVNLVQGFFLQYPHEDMDYDFRNLRQ